MTLGSSLTFGHFEVRPAERTLVVAGVPAPVGARAFDVLLALIDRRDRVVSKNELLDLVWPGLVVEENNLSVQISALRKVLGAVAITTVAGRGYRFTASASDQPEAQRAERAAEASSRIVRRLGTVACADIVNWEQSLSNDALRSIASWKSIRTSLIDNLVPVYCGQIQDASSQGVLIEFPSAVEALDQAARAKIANPGSV